MKRPPTGTFPSPKPATATVVNPGADSVVNVTAADPHPSPPRLRNRLPAELQSEFDATASSDGSARSASITTPSTTNVIPVGATAVSATTLAASGMQIPGLAACPAAQPLLRLWTICMQSNTPIPDLYGVSESERLDQLTEAVKDNNLGRIAALILAGAPLRPQAMSGVCVARSARKYIPSTSNWPLAKAINKAHTDALDVLLLHPAAAAEKLDAGYLIVASAGFQNPSDDQAKLMRKMLIEGFAVEQRGQFPVIDSALASYVYATGGYLESTDDVELFLSSGANPNIWMIDDQDPDDEGQFLADYLQEKFDLFEEDDGVRKHLPMISTCINLIKSAGCIVHDEGAMEMACHANDVVELEKQQHFDLRDKTAREKFPQTVDTMDTAVFPDPVIRDLLNHPEATKANPSFENFHYPYYFDYQKIFSDPGLSAQEYKDRLISALTEAKTGSGLISAVVDLLGTENSLLDAMTLKGYAPTETQVSECLKHLFEGLVSDPILNARANASYVKSGLSVLTQKNLANLVRSQAKKVAFELLWRTRHKIKESLLISEMKNFLARCLYMFQPVVSETVNQDATTSLRAFLVQAGFFEPLVSRILDAWASVNLPQTDLISLVSQSDEISDEALINTEAGEALANQFGRALLEQFKLDKPSVLVPPEGSGADKDAFAVIMQPQYELVTGYARSAAEFKRSVQTPDGMLNSSAGHSS